MMGKTAMESTIEYNDGDNINKNKSVVFGSDGDHRNGFNERKTKLESIMALTLNPSPLIEMAIMETAS